MASKHIDNWRRLDPWKHDKRQTKREYGAEVSAAAILAGKRVVFASPTPEGIHEMIRDTNRALARLRK